MRPPRKTAKQKQKAPEEALFAFVWDCEIRTEYALNALRLRGGFALLDFTERTGLPVTAIAKPLQAAEAKGLIERDFARVRPTERGFDFLSDLQELFLAD